jgi:hypothetical protein
MALIRNLIFVSLFLYLFTSLLSAESVDTVIYSDGGPGPYRISEGMLDQRTISVSFDKDSAVIPPWVFIPGRNSLLFSETIDSGVPIRVRFQTAFYGITQSFSLFPKTYSKAGTLYDTSTGVVATAYRESENLTVSGYKSIGVAIGSFGELNLEQGLDVRIGGQIRPGTEINAHLSDQGTSLDGATREISEFDMIYVALTDPKFGAVAGDQYINWLPSGIFKEQKKIKGLSASFHPKAFSVNAFGALSGGMHTSETWHGQNGVQGPYTLSGKGEPGFITPIGGTVKVVLNGKILIEGEDKDFTVDYDLGSITFNPRVLIKDNDIIRVEYEYKLFDYQRTIVGASAGFSAPDSIFTVKGALWSEADNRNHPIDLSLSAADMKALREAGDSPPMASSHRPVHRNDVPSDDALYPLYKIQDGHFVHRRYNPSKPDSVDGFYYVWFKHVGDGNGDYVRTDSLIHREFVYKYAGEGMGDYSPLSELPPPRRFTKGELIADVNLEFLKARINAAGQEADQNLFSSIDDDDNLGSSVVLSFVAGSDQIRKRGVWLSGDYLYSSKQFGNELQETFDRYRKWNDRSLIQNSGSRQIWESAVGVTPFPGFSTCFGYGQNRFDSDLMTDKFYGNSKWLPADWLSLDYNGSFFRHNGTSSGELGRLENAGVNLMFDNINVGTFFRDEWKPDSSAPGTGLIEGTLRFGYEPWKLQESITFTSFRAGKGFLTSSDTGYSILWEQSVNHRILPGWQVAASGNYQRNVNNGAGSLSTFLAEFSSSIEPAASGFSSHLRYRTNSEKSSVFIQVPVFAGKGLGTHIYDDSLKEYVPHTPGDWFMQQREIYDKTASTRIRKTVMEIDWQYRPLKQIKGILNDLTWQGTLLSEEHVEAGLKTVSSWIPGINSLNEHFRDKGHSSSSYADISYRQEAQWVPQGREDLRGDIFVTPSFRKIRSYREPGIQSGFNLELKRGRWTFRDETKHLYFFRDDSLESDFYVRDLNTELTQSFRIGDAFDIYLKECAGWARKDNRSTLRRKVSVDSCVYLQINPGLSWAAFDKGWLEASYALSIVNIPGELDYRIARGFGSGLSQVFSVASEIQIGKHFSVNGSYRAELRRVDMENLPGLHTLSLQIKAFL